MTQIFFTLVAVYWIFELTLRLVNFGLRKLLKNSQPVRQRSVRFEVIFLYVATAALVTTLIAAIYMAVAPYVWRNDGQVSLVGGMILGWFSMWLYQLVLDPLINIREWLIDRLRRRF